MTLFKDKQRLTIFLAPELITNLKLEAIKKGISLSELISNTLTNTTNTTNTKAKLEEVKPKKEPQELPQDHIILSKKPYPTKTLPDYQSKAPGATKTSLFCKKHHRMAIGGLFPCGCSS